MPDGEVVCRSWEELVAALVRSDTSRWWIFRGMGDARWDLDSSLTRVLKRSTWPHSDGRAAERSAIGYFKQQARGELRDPPDNLNLWGWLALMQHYGAPTRLLDWTMSPFVACYFAYESAEDGHDAALWALQAFYCRWITARGSTYPFDETFIDQKRASVVNPVTRSEAENRRLRKHICSESPWPMPLLPNWVDARMVAQQAMFTAVGDLTRRVDSLWEPANEKKLDSLASSIKTDVPEPHLTTLGLPTSGTFKGWHFLKRVRLQSAWRGKALDTLNRMGISRGSLFPGLDGIGKTTAENLQRETYSLRDLLSPMLSEAELQEPGY